jgi:RNA polymerase sigma-70 factor (ECF subfamily)
MTDAEIVELYLNRDEAAIKATAARYQSMLQRVAMQILNDMEDAEECVNDTYFAAWNAVPETIPSHLGAFLCRIVRKKAIDKLRTNTRKKRCGQEYYISLEELSEVLKGDESPEKALDDALLTEAIQRFLRDQTADVRKLFLGRYFWFCPLKEVANSCGMSEGNAKTVLYRTRKKLRDFLEKEGFMP